MSKQTVNEEMPVEQRTEELILGLSSTGADNVFCEISHLIQVFGMDKADKLMESAVEMQQVINPNRSEKSTLRTYQRRSGVAQVNRKAALEAALDARAQLQKAKVDAKLPVPKSKD